MTVTVKGSIKAAIIILAVLSQAGYLCAEGAFARPVQPEGSVVNDLYKGVRGHSAARSSDMAKILAALETRVGDAALLEKAEAKLSSLSGKDLALIASLCDRMPADGRTTGSDIAFALATVLVILS